MSTPKSFTTSSHLISVSEIFKYQFFLQCSFPYCNGLEFAGVACMPLLWNQFIKFNLKWQNVWYILLVHIKDVTCLSTGQKDITCTSVFFDRSSADTIIWTASCEFGTYRICEQRSFRRACASAQSCPRTSAARSYKQWVKRNHQIESQIPGPFEWLGTRSKNLSWQNARRHKFAWGGPSDMDRVHWSLSNGRRNPKQKYGKVMDNTSISHLELKISQKFWPNETFFS